MHDQKIMQIKTVLYQAILGGCQILQIKEESTNLSYDGTCPVSSLVKINFSLMAAVKRLIVKPMQVPQE